MGFVGMESARRARDLMDNFRLTIDDMNILIQKWNTHKRPVLAVQFKDENCIYKVASFNDETTARWFVECLQEQFKDYGPNGPWERMWQDDLANEGTNKADM